MNIRRTHIQKTSCFEAAPPGNTIAYKNVVKALKSGNYIF